MALHEEIEDSSFADFNYEDDSDSLAHRKKVRRMLEDRLERKRLKDEFKDDFDELNGEFEWDDFDK